MSNGEAKLPSVRSAVFRADQETGCLIVRSVVAVSVDGGSARLQPSARRPGGSGDRSTHGASRSGAGFFDLASIVGVVSAVNVPPGHIDNGVGAFEICRPLFDCLAIPSH